MQCRKNFAWSQKLKYSWIIFLQWINGKINYDVCIWQRKKPLSLLLPCKILLLCLEAFFYEGGTCFQAFMSKSSNKENFATEFLKSDFERNKSKNSFSLNHSLISIQCLS